MLDGLRVHGLFAFVDLGLMVGSPGMAQSRLPITENPNKVRYDTK